ncbi:MAG: IPT/TIG domain-containing protein, partial [Rhizobiaceae bacterium]|nr:IPT/TIG domain-containing protein [Rhizobiaceae bacterium]
MQNYRMVSWKTSKQFARYGLLLSLVLMLCALGVSSEALAATCQYNLTFTATGSANAQIAQTYNDGCDGQEVGLYSGSSTDVNNYTAIGASGYEEVTSSKGITYYFLWNAPPAGDDNSGYSIYLGTQVANGPDTITLYAASINSSGPVDTTITFNFTIPALGPTVTAISPNSGPTAGGRSVTVTGTGFVVGSTSVTIGGNSASDVVVNSSTSLTATTPAGSAGAASVIVTASGASNAANTLYTYLAAPVASSFTSSAVAYNTGSATASSIDVSGHATNSPGSYAVGSATTAQGGSVSISSAGLASYTPPTGFRGNDSFTYTATNVGGTSSPATVTVPVGDPTIAVSPTTLTDGTYGTAYSQALTLSGGRAPYTFSTTLASGALPTGLTLSSSGTISGTPTTTGSFSFTVIGTDSSVGNGPATFTSSTISLTVNTAVPTVTSISPTSGPTAGGTSVTIAGTNLIGATAVTFGGTAALSVTVNSATQITATAPAGIGTVDVTVTTSGGTSTTSSSDQFTYVAAPMVTSISPTSGPTAGGTSVVITGANLTGATSVTFGGTAANFTVNSATSITATAPSKSVGTVDVIVITPGGTSTTSDSDQFTYIAVPTVTSISPTSGPTAGGTSVTITGTGLSGATSVTFGGTAAASFTVNSATQITATSPAGSAGTVDLRVTTSGGTSATNGADDFSYVSAPTVSTVATT